MRKISFILVAVSAFFRAGGARAAEVPELAARLAALFPDGRHETWELPPASPLELIKEYVRDHIDAGWVDDYTFVEEADGLEVDEMIAGTLAGGVPEAEVAAALAGDEPERAALAILAEMRAAGGTFGFDGFWQNACAAPTPFLLVMDTRRGFVEGIDLNPCVE